VTCKSVGDWHTVCFNRYTLYRNGSKLSRSAKVNIKGKHIEYGKVPVEYRSVGLVEA